MDIHLRLFGALADRAAEGGNRVRKRLTIVFFAFFSFFARTGEKSAVTMVDLVCLVFSPSTLYWCFGGYTFESPSLAMPNQEHCLMLCCMSVFAEQRY